MRLMLCGAATLGLAACGSSSLPPAEFHDISAKEAAHKVFERGLLKNGLWSAKVKVNSGSVGSLPGDSAGARAVVQMVNAKLAAQPEREIQLCMSDSNIESGALPGFLSTCQIKSLAFIDDEAKSTTICAGAKDIDPGKIEQTMRASDGKLLIETTMYSTTDLGGMGKPRPKVASMTATWTYQGPCRQAQPAMK